MLGSVTGFYMAVLASQVVEQTERALANGVRMLVCHGPGDSFTEELDNGLHPELKTLLRSPLVTRRLVDGRVHSFKSPVGRAQTSDELVRWVDCLAGGR